MLEKGPESLATLRYIMALCRDYSVYPICGNCDTWLRICDSGSPRMLRVLREYINQKPQSTVAQMCREAEIEIGHQMDILAMKEDLRRRFNEEFSFLAGLPTIIETKHYTFVHGGLPEGELTELDAYECMKNDNFMNQGRRFDKWCIVGHWPVVLYGENITNANPIIDRNARIISIDGGCVLKDDGQLNGLIIPEDGSEDFTWEYYDHFPQRRVKTDQAGSESSCYIRWGDNLVEVLEPGPEFSLCRHLRTGYRLKILTKYLYGNGPICRCNDYTDYVLSLKAGDVVSVVESTSCGYLVKHRGVSGWYYGELLPL
jgi:protein phosphatase